MLPLTAGILVAGPASGWLSDRYGARPFATGGMLGSAASFALLMIMPVNFSYMLLGPVLFLGGLSAGLFMAPNTVGIMNSLPARERGAGSGIRATFMNTGTVLSMGLFFTLMIVGFSAKLAGALFSGLTAQGLPAQTATQISHLPAVSSLFAALLGYNPLGTMIPQQVLAALPAATAAHVTGTEFFPQLISAAFQQGLRVIFGVGFVLCLLAAAASWMRGTKYVYEEKGETVKPVAGLEGGAVLAGHPAGCPGGETGAPACLPVRVAPKDHDAG